MCNKHDANCLPMPGDGNFNVPLTNWLFHHGNIEELDARIFHFSYKAGGFLGNPFEKVELFSGQYEWKNVSTPHDWLVEMPVDPSGNPENGYKIRDVGWYYMALNLPDIDIEDVRLVFEGILGQSTVYINGTIVGRNFSGYNKFSMDVGDYLLPGEKNIFAVYVDARRWECWSYEGAGIYRPAYLEFRNKNHLYYEKCFIRGAFVNNQWQVVADLSIKDENGISVHTVIKDENEKIVAEATIKEISFKVPVNNPLLWSPEHPHLYKAICEVFVNNNLIDSISANIGFRTIVWTTDKGMLLNGEPYQIKGICCHQDHAGVGAALTSEIMEYRLRILKNMGANAYRCAHNQPKEELLEMCDRLGLLVMSENRHFSTSEEVMAQLDSLIYVSRNHPCVFMYSIFNEEPWQKEKRGVRMARKMIDRIRMLDDTRPVTAAMDGGTLTEFNTSSVLDVIGMNYFIKDYEETHRRNPEKVIIGSENAPTLATRGEYFTDPKRQVFSNYPENKVVFSEFLNETMEAVEKYPFVAGCFVWNGFSYRGESNCFYTDFPKEWPSVGCHWGFTDYCGFKKDTAYWVMAWYQKELMAHLFPHWNWKPGDTVRVASYTNGDTAELFLNGISLGVKPVVGKYVEWEVAYSPGILEVIVSRGDEKCRDVIKTAGEAYKIVLEDVTPYESSLHIVNVMVVDQEGTVLPDFSETVDFFASDGKVLGVGNGDPNSHHNDNDTSISFFHGHAQVIVSGKDLTVKCNGIPEESLYWK